MSFLIRYVRKRSGLSQKNLAELAGVGKTVVYDIEKGKETIQVNSLLKIIKVLNIKIEFKPPLNLGNDQNEET